VPSAGVAPIPAINPSRSGRLGRMEDSFNYAARLVQGRVFEDLAFDGRMFIASGSIVSAPSGQEPIAVGGGI
jgi:hypothetical protein